MRYFRVFLMIVLCLNFTSFLQAADDVPQDIEKSEPIWIEMGHGLAYQLIQEGKGERPVQQNDHVTIFYKAKVQGTDTHFAWTEKGKGFAFQVGNATVLPGIQKGVIGMRAYEHRIFRVPPKLGFGTTLRKGIPANSTLIVDLQVIKIYEPVKIEVLEEGPKYNRAAVNGNVIAVNYVGKLEDGTVFDSNESLQVPFRFGQGTSGVISGFATGTLGMRVGDKRRVTIPPHFGYGKIQRPNIPANSTLIFDLKCLAIEDGFAIKTLKTGSGPAIGEGETGLFSVRIELFTGKVVTDTQFSKPKSLPVQKSLDPIGLYYMIQGMKVGEVRQATIKPQLGFAPGKRWAGRALNVTMDLIEISKETSDKPKKESTTKTPK